MWPIYFNNLYNEFTHIATSVHGDEAVFVVFLIGFIMVLFSGPIEHWEAALIILRESGDAMTRLADMLLFNTSTVVYDHQHY